VADARADHVVPAAKPCAALEAARLEYPQNPSRTRLSRITSPRVPGSRTAVVRTAGAPAARHGSAWLQVLHGCNQDHIDMQTITRFDELADRYGFVVVYPFIRPTGMASSSCIRSLQAIGACGSEIAGDGGGA
jgi:poly(3-hydroxybutyrate) depolymerase